MLIHMIRSSIHWMKCWIFVIIVCLYLCLQMLIQCKLVIVLYASTDLMFILLYIYCFNLLFSQRHMIAESFLFLYVCLEFPCFNVCNNNCDFLLLIMDICRTMTIWSFTCFSRYMWACLSVLADKLMSACTFGIIGLFVC